MEENKNCCENKSCERGCCGNSHGCCVWSRCRGMKYIVVIVLIIIAFCLGTQLGQLKSEARGCHMNRGGMMNWNYKNVKPLTGDEIPNTPATPTPTVTQ